MDKEIYNRIINRMKRKIDESILEKSFWQLQLFLKIHNYNRSQLYRRSKPELENLDITTNKKDFYLLLKNDKTRSFSRRWKLRLYLQKKLNYENVIIDIHRNEKIYDDIIRDCVTRMETAKKSLKL
jgi:hypothetical protein